MGIGLGMLGLGLTSSLVGRQGGASYSAEAEALFARFTTPPTESRKALIDTFITSLKTAGVWTKLDALWVMAAADEQAARQNWKQDLYNLTAISSPTFTADRGFTNNGSTSHLTTGFTPSTAGGQWTLDSAHLGVWSRTNAVVAGAVMGGRTTSTTGQALMTLRSTSDVCTVRINQDGTVSSTNTNSSGDFIARRSVAASAALYRNGAVVVSGAAVSTTLPAAAIVIGGINTGGVVTTSNTYELAQASLGATLSDAEITAFYNAKLTYLQAVGAA
ncbi:MAG: hypothetical protein E5X86_22650 [Mesorhizobium sp.]|uniref:hypothetical protein n=1 Tax=Mesorhizobium sp. TaxID=1871066 RepID=UPI00120A8F21|nr:hypothetical protein [Mesorhizobium sp.]TIO14922.1 MAG: hypothetical protein E5X86_22650 [Mesorhizobium sp.]